jgi:hypothetical protein
MSTESGNVATSGGIVLFSAIMGVSVVACLCCVGVMCAKRRRRAKEELQTSIEMANFYESAGTGARSAQSPPPPGLSQIVPAATAGVGPELPMRVARGKTGQTTNDRFQGMLQRNGARKKKRRNQTEDERQADHTKPVTKKKKKKKKKKKNDDGRRKRSKSSSNERTNRKGGPLPARRKIQWEHQNERTPPQEDDVVVAEQEDEEPALELNNNKKNKKKKAKTAKKAKKAEKKRRKREKRRKRKKRSEASATGDEQGVVSASESDDGDGAQNTNVAVAVIGSEIAAAIREQKDDLPPTPKQVGESVAIDVKSEPYMPKPPPRRPGGALRGSLPVRRNGVEKIQPNTASIASQLQELVSPQREDLRRTTISLSIVSSPDPNHVGDTVGPVVLHNAFKVASIGSAEGQPLKVTGDGSIEQEHGLVSYRADTVLYVNVSGAPTTIDGRSIGPAGAPVTLTSGSVLGLGDTRLLATTFTEFVATSD